MKIGDFHETISKLLDTKLKPVIDRQASLNLVTCVEIYTTIFETLVECITEANIDVTNESVNFIAQQYYDGILVNGTQELDPDIFTTRASLDKIETKELALLSVMLGGTDFAVPIIQEIKKRS